MPGLIQRHGLPNVMRGEETQVFGVLRDARAVPDAGLLIGLPGTHCGSARNGQVTHFDTFMTGEVTPLRGHTILGRTMSDAAAPDMAAFERGLKVAGAPEGRAGVLSTIFSTRAGPDRRTGAGLAGRLPVGPADRPRDRRPGRHAARAGPGARIVLCGEPALCERYTLAMTHYGLGAPEQAQNATERGLWHLALAAGLVPSSSISA